MRRSRRVACIVNVVGIDTHQRSSVFGEVGGCLKRDERMSAVPVCLGSPMRIPTGMKQNGLAFDWNLSYVRYRDGPIVWRLLANNHRIEISQRVKIELRQIRSVRITMKRTIDVRAGVGDHFDFANVKLSAGGVHATRLLPRQMI